MALWPFKQIDKIDYNTYIDKIHYFCFYIKFSLAFFVKFIVEEIKCYFQIGFEEPQLTFRWSDMQWERRAQFV